VSALARPREPGCRIAVPVYAPGGTRSEERGVTPKVERLVNLTVALLEARRPLTLAELKQRTGYYTQEDAESGRRMFERDKDDLRRLGVPIETREVAFGEELGYVVPRRTYELPDVKLTAEEVAALALAVRLTGTGAQPLAFAKLAARSPDPAELDARPTTRVELAPEPVDAVADAVILRAPLRFTYRTAAGSVAERTIDPYGVVRRRAAWYLVGRDHDRDALRAFRLDRITDRPRIVGEGGGYELPDDLDVVAAVSGPEVESGPAELAVSPSARWAVESRGGRDTGRSHDGWPVLVMDHLDRDRGLSMLLGLGADVIVLAPPDLRADVIAALQRVADQVPA
jgi:proteasome accessory factor B